MFEPADSRRRLVSSAAARLCAAAASLAFSLPAGAQLEIVLEPRTSIVESAVASDGAIWLQTETPVGPSNRRYALIRVSPDLDSYSERELPNSFRRGIAAFRDGVLMPSSEPGSPGTSSQLHLNWIGPEPDAAIASWYTWSNNPGADTFKDFVAPASDGSAVYVVSRELGAQLSQLGANGEEQWRRFLGEQRVYGIVATLEGVAVDSISTVVGQPARATLTGFSPDGDEAWRIENPRIGGDILFVPPNTLASRQAAEYRTFIGATEPPELLFLDTRARSVRSLSIWAWADRVRPVLGGLLLFESGQRAFVALIDDEAKIRWTKRLNFDNGAPSGTTRLLVDVQTPAPDQIVLITGRRSAGELGALEPTAVEFIRTSLEMPGLAASYGRCVETDLRALREREQVVRRDFGIGIRLLPGAFPQTARLTDADGCALPSESDYVRFTSEVADELARRSAEQRESPTVFVNITVATPESPYLLSSYDVNLSVRDAPATSVQYVAKASAGRALAEHLTETVKPHFARMVTAANEFREMTGCRLTVEQPADERPPPDLERFYAETEEAVDHVLAEARRIGAELNPAESASRYCALLVNARGFGRYRELKPLSQAAETLREAAAATNNR